MPSEAADNSQLEAMVVEIEDLYVQRTEVTVSQYAAFCRDSGRPESCQTVEGESDFPVIVSHEEASEYAAFYGSRLPTSLEYQWLLSAKGRFDAYPWLSADARPPVNYGNLSGEERASSGGGVLKPVFLPGYRDRHSGLAPVASYDIDLLGLYDLGGNVAEWCSDGGTVGTVRINGEFVDERPGAYIVCADYRADLRFLRCDFRVLTPKDTSYPVGFRCVKSPESE